MTNVTWSLTATDANSGNARRAVGAHVVLSQKLVRHQLLADRIQ